MHNPFTILHLQHQNNNFAFKKHRTHKINKCLLGAVALLHRQRLSGILYLQPAVWLSVLKIKGVLRI